MKVIAKTNPTNSTKFNPNATQSDFIEACGLIPMWVGSWAMSDQEKDLEEFCVDSYGMGGRPYNEFTIAENGELISKYPEDPNTIPIAQFTAENGEELWMYEHAWVRFTKSGNVYRMD